MSINLSSSSNDYLHHSNSSTDSFQFYCFRVMPASIAYIAFFISNALILLPLCIFILYLGYQRWREQGFASTMSPSDNIVYNMVIMELFGVLGCILCSSGIYNDHTKLLMVGFSFWCFSWYGETFFNILTCLERYLAVVHPIIYMRLKKERGHKIRNITTGCVWLLCLGVTGLVFEERSSLIFELCLLIAFIIIMSFCSLSVLCVLIRQRPGEKGGNRERIDQSKRRAFDTIMAILVALLMRCIMNLVWTVKTLQGGSSSCVSLVFGVWFNVPGSLALPLLFLRRAGAITCWKRNHK